MKLLKHCVNQKLTANPVKSVFQGLVKGPQTECNGDAECTRSEKCIDGFCRSTGGNGPNEYERWRALMATAKVLKTKARGIGDLVNTEANLASKAKGGAGGNGPDSTNGGKGGANGNGQGGTNETNLEVLEIL